MTDTTVAPSAPAAPSAAPNEAVIEQNQVSLPNPIGSQAPDKPASDIKGSEHRPQSRREAIQAAFDRANTPQRDKPKAVPKPEPKAAEAKPGHNNPPEETPPEKLDLKKRPDDGKQQDARPRGDHGHFAAREPVAERQPDTQQTKPAGSSLPSQAPYREPPPRMADHAKRDWAAAPESIRGEIHRMHHEFSNAYNFYRADHEAMQPIRHFHALAQQQGTTLEKALTNYVSIEQKLRADPVAGLDVIVNNLNLKTPDGQKIGLRDIAYHVLNQSPEQLQVLQQGNAQTAANQQIGSLYREISALKNHLQQMHTAQQFTYSRAAVDQFADSHPRFDELSGLIERELRLGFDLDTAYRRAELLSPATHAAQTRTQSAQTRTTADRSISGAPAGPTNGGGRRASEKPVGRREAIQHAIKRVNGSL